MVLRPHNQSSYSIRMTLQQLTVLSDKPLLPNYDIYDIYFTLLQWYLELLSSNHNTLALVLARFTD